MYDNGKYIGWIYCIENNVNGKKYIGQTINKPEQRFQQHIHSSVEGVEDNNMVLPKAIAKYGEGNFTMSILNEFIVNSKEELTNILNETEIKYIKQFHTLTNENGYNITKGGNYVSDLSYVKVDQYTLNGEFVKTWDSMSEAARSFGAEGKYGSRIGEVCRGERGGISAFGYTWRYHGEPFEKHGVSFYTKNPIDVYDIYGNLIVSLNSFDEATILDDLDYVDKYELRKNIKRCCTGKKISYYKGYVFRYVNEPFEKYEVNVQHFLNNRINKYSVNGEYLQTYNSVSEAEREHKNDGTSSGGKISCCLHKMKHHITAYGFRWYYEHDPSQPDPSRIRTRLNQTNPKAIEYIKNQQMQRAS